MSGELVELLLRRAKAFLEISETLITESNFDIAVFSLEQAAQLRIKAVMLRLFGDYPRIHGLRELLGLLAARLSEAGFTDLAREVRDFAADNRGLLWVLEEAYTLARYGYRSYTGKEAEELRGLVQSLWSLLDRVETGVLG